MHFTPNHKITSLPPNCVFVFGSNLEGHHTGGAAKDALDNFGAKWGQGEGLQGQSYAIPTMQGGVSDIKPYVDRFISFAKAHYELDFYVTHIGCGIADRPLSEMANLFKDALDLRNVILQRAFVLAIYAEEALRSFGVESRFFDNREVFPRNAFPELERADIICTDCCDVFTIIKKENKYGLFEYDDFPVCGGGGLKIRSVGPIFGYDDIRFCDNRTGYRQDGYYENYSGYVALNESGHWSVLALDCNDPCFLICEGDSLEEVTQKVDYLTGLRHIFWCNPIELQNAR